MVLMATKHNKSYLQTLYAFVRTCWGNEKSIMGTVASEDIALAKVLTEWRHNLNFCLYFQCWVWHGFHLYNGTLILCLCEMSCVRHFCVLFITVLSLSLLIPHAIENIIMHSGLFCPFNGVSISLMKLRCCKLSRPKYTHRHKLTWLDILLLLT